MSKPNKEAIAHENSRTEKVEAETLNERQKMQLHNSPADGPGIGIANSHIDVVSISHCDEIIAAQPEVDCLNTQEENAIDAMSYLDNRENSYTDLFTGNPPIMNKRKDDSISHITLTNTVPETLNLDTQKMLMHNSSNGGPGTDTLSHTLRELHISKFGIKTNCDHITDYLSKKGINLSNVRVFRLTKKDQDLSLLSFVSFKIETNSEIADSICAPDFWPAHVTIKNFIRKTRASLSNNRSPEAVNEDFFSRQPLSTHQT